MTEPILTNEDIDTTIKNLQEYIFYAEADGISTITLKNTLDVLTNPSLKKSLQLKTWIKENWHFIDIKKMFPDMIEKREMLTGLERILLQIILRKSTELQQILIGVEK